MTSADNTWRANPTPWDWPVTPVEGMALLRCFIMTKKIWHGFWWLPGRENHRFPGTLHVEDSGQSRLTLMGGFDLDQASRLPVDDNEDDGTLTILGLCGAVQITLVGGHGSLWHGSSRSPEYQEVRGSRALVGAHVVTTDPVFASVMFTLENFGTFLGRHAFDRTAVLRGGSSSVVYNPVDKINFSADGWTFRLYTYFPGFQPDERRGSNVVEGTTREVLIATPEFPRPLIDFDAITKAFMDLLTLASGEACGVTEMSLELAEDKNADYPPGDGRSYRRVEEYGRRIHTARPDDLPQQSGRFRFTCSDMSFEELTSAWLPLRRRASSATDLFFGLYYARPGFTETRLLSAAVVAESLHTTLLDSPPRWDKEEFKSLRAAISASIPDLQQREWVNARIKNQQSFRERLIQLALHPNQHAVAALVGDADTWAKKVVDARNGLAHTGADTNKKGDLFELTEVTLFLASLALMQELGLSGEVQMKAFERDEYLSVIRHKSSVATG